jgi:hypothetical protein
MDENLATLRQPEADVRYQTFMRLWGVGLIGHVVGNWLQPDLPTLVGVANLIVGILGVLLVLAPQRRVFLAASLATIVSLLGEMPFTGNHWLIAGLVSVAALVTWARPNHLIPAGRWILMVFYVFAAFAKLNSGFFDPTVSCALFFANQSLAGFGFPAIDPSSWLSRVPIWTSALVELAIPALLAFRRWRYFGVVVASLFHIIISFDLGQHFYDFTSLLLPLFFLFLPTSSVEKLATISQGWRPSSASAIALAVILVLLVLSVTPPTDTSSRLLERVPFVLWIPAALLWLVTLVRAKGSGEALNWQPAWGGAAVALAVLNGLTPYTEVKTAYGFNMYSNLRTARGESNHFILRHTLPLRGGYRAPVEILYSSDPGLQQYAELDYLIAYPQLRQYLSNHKDVSIRFRRGNAIISLDRASENPKVTDPGPFWWRFFPLRAIDSRDPPRCQDAFLAAT